MKSADKLGQSEKIRYAERDAELRQMRIIATALLLAMAALFVFGKYMETRYYGYWGFLRAFAEAGMVGGLADWFAVTALFRHPLGIPIAHTAIIPNNKERLGRTLASFLRTNFLTTKVVARRVQRMDVAGAMGKFLSAPAGGEGRTDLSAKDWSEQVVAKLPMIAEPGTAWNYSQGLDVLGGVIEKITGKSLEEAIRERVTGPLGMTDTGFYVPPDKVRRLAGFYDADPATGKLIRAPERGGDITIEPIGGDPPRWRTLDLLDARIVRLDVRGELRDGHAGFGLRRREAVGRRKHRQGRATQRQEHDEQQGDEPRPAVQQTDHRRVFLTCRR